MERRVVREREKKNVFGLHYSKNKLLGDAKGAITGAYCGAAALLLSVL